MTNLHNPASVFTLNLQQIFGIPISRVKFEIKKQKKTPTALRETSSGAARPKDIQIPVNVKHGQCMRNEIPAHSSVSSAT